MHPSLLLWGLLFRKSHGRWGFTALQRFGSPMQLFLILNFLIEKYGNNSTARRASRRLLFVLLVYRARPAAYLFAIHSATSPFWYGCLRLAA